MAKAGGNTTTTGISLCEARALVVRAYEASQLAEDLLVKWLGEGRVRWSCGLFEGARVSDLATLQRDAATAGVCFFVANVAYSEGDPAFWRTSLEINWEESWAREMYAIGGTRAYRIRVAREDVLALLPEEPGERDKPKSGGRKLAQAKELLKEMYPPDGLAPDSTSMEQISQEARVICQKRGISAPGYDTFARARRALMVGK